MKLYHVAYYAGEESVVVLSNDAKEMPKTLVFGNGNCIIKRSSETRDPETGIAFFRYRGEPYCRSERDALILMIRQLEKMEATIVKAKEDALDQMSTLSEQAQ